MRVLVEHPVYVPYTAITGGTELFVRNVVAALELRGHDVTVFGSADSALPCIRSTAYSSAWMATQTGDTKTKLWYDELGEASADYDAVILNTSLSSCLLLDPRRAHWYSKATHFNHNGSDWFTGGFGGKQMQSVLRYLRANGCRNYYFSEKHRAVLDSIWADPKKRDAALKGKVEPGLRRIGALSFLDLDPWTGHFDQSLFPTDAVPARAGEGYVVAIGRDVPDKRLHLARAMGEKLGRETFVLTDMDHGDVMEVLAGADALILASKHETFCITAFEAIAHGVPVMALEVPPSLESFAELTLPWGKAFKTTSVTERVEIQAYLRKICSLEVMGRRLQNTLWRDKRQTDLTV